MYKQIKTKGSISKTNLKKAFAPLENYLDKEHPQHKEDIIHYMMFMGNQENQFYYKNKITRRYIIFNQKGELVSCCEDALKHQFDWGMDEREKEKVSFEERFIHENVKLWIQKHLKRKSLSVFHEMVSLFLQDIWGPLVNFDFKDLKAGYPLHKLRAAKTLYLTSPHYLDDIAFQFVGDDIAMQKCSLNDYLRYERLERELNAKGWRVLTYTRSGIPDYQVQPLFNFLSKEIIDFPEDTVFELVQTK